MKGRGGYVPDLCTGDRNNLSSEEAFRWTCRTVFISVLMGGGGTPESLRSFMSFFSDETLGRVTDSLRSMGVFTMVGTYTKCVECIPFEFFRELMNS